MKLGWVVTVTALMQFPAAAWAGAGDCGCDPTTRPSSWNAAWYAGLGFNSASYNRNWSIVPRANDGSYVAQSHETRSQGAAVFGGVEFLRYLALEAGYADYGEVASTAQSDGSGTFFDAGAVEEPSTRRGT